MAQAWKSIINGFIVSCTSSFDQLKIKKRNQKVNHYREGIYTSFKLELSAFTEVVQWIEALTFSSSWGSGFKSLEANFS